MKLPAFARTRPLLFSRTLLSNLLNKIQFTFKSSSLLDFRPFQTILLKVCINFSPVLRGGGRMGGEGGAGGEGGWGGRWQKPPGEDTR